MTIANERGRAPVLDPGQHMLLKYRQPLPLARLKPTRSRPSSGLGLKEKTGAQGSDLAHKNAAAITIDTRDFGRIVYSLCRMRKGNALEGRKPLPPDSP